MEERGNADREIFEAARAAEGGSRDGKRLDQGLTAKYTAEYGSGGNGKELGEIVNKQGRDDKVPQHKKASKKALIVTIFLQNLLHLFSCVSFRQAGLRKFKVSGITGLSTERRQNDLRKFIVEQNF